MKIYPAMVALVGALALGLAGCGGNEPTSAGSGAQGASGTAPSRTASPGSTTSPPAVPPGVAAQYTTIRKEIAAEGGQTTKGPWRIGYIVEDAEGWFADTVSGNARWREPAPGETNHIEILPFEKDGGRFVPGVPITVKVIDDQGRVIDRHELELYYSPEFFHYASNFSIPQAGRYTLDVTLEVPEFPRHGEKQASPALAEGAHVRFENVKLG